MRLSSDFENTVGFYNSEIEFEGIGEFRITEEEVHGDDFDGWEISAELTSAQDGQHTFDRAQLVARFGKAQIEANEIHAEEAFKEGS